MDERWPDGRIHEKDMQQIRRFADSLPLISRRFRQESSFLVPVEAVRLRDWQEQEQNDTLTRNLPVMKYGVSDNGSDDLPTSFHEADVIHRLFIWTGTYRICAGQKIMIARPTYFNPQISING
jgi:hypothetical protein